MYICKFCIQISTRVHKYVLPVINSQVTPHVAQYFPVTFSAVQPYVSDYPNIASVHAYNILAYSMFSISKLTAIYHTVR